MLASKNGRIVLPCDVTHEMFIKYCDHDSLCNTRELQSTRVRRCTQFKDMEKAIKAGNLENVKWISSQNDEWKEKKKADNCLRCAVEGGHLDCLRWLFHALQGCSCEGMWWLYGDAAMGGHVEICIWLMENGCLFNSFSFDFVIRVGNIEVMEWCLQNGGVFNERTFWRAAKTQNIEVLEWLKVKDCTWGYFSLQLARNHRLHNNVITWIQENGCPQV